MDCMQTAFLDSNKSVIFNVIMSNKCNLYRLDGQSMIAEKHRSRLYSHTIILNANIKSDVFFDICLIQSALHTHRDLPPLLDLSKLDTSKLTANSTF